MHTFRTNGRHIPPADADATLRQGHSKYRNFGTDNCCFRYYQDHVSSPNFHRVFLCIFLFQHIDNICDKHLTFYIPERYICPDKTGNRLKNGRPAGVKLGPGNCLLSCYLLIYRSKFCSVNRKQVYVCNEIKNPMKNVQFFTQRSSKNVTRFPSFKTGIPVSIGPSKNLLMV